MGSQLDRLLDRNPRNCKLRAVDSIGMEVDGGNFSGAIGMLQNKVIDIILFAESNRYLKRDFFKVSLMVEHPSLLLLFTV